MIHLDDIDEIWNHSQFDEHCELIQSGGYETLYQVAGASGAPGATETTVATATPSSAETSTELSVVIWILIVILILACIGLVVVRFIIPILSPPDDF